MGEPLLPAQLIEARHTPVFDYQSIPDALAASHRTTVWAELRVQAGNVRYLDLEGDDPRDERLDPGETAVIVPGVEHHVELSTDAQFYVQFFREPDAELIPGPDAVPEWTDSLRRSGPWERRGRDVDTIGAVTDYWAHVLLYAPDYEINVIESHRHSHELEPFTPELFDRWLQIFHDTVDGGWAGPRATIAKKRATGMAWAMAQRFLGQGVWRPTEHR